ncbi:MAG TPA: glycosyltransferase family 2 protein [Thermoanaerobaculia bacterium]|nr:glycosyltransferase family 2 protein [Thermoanaerobaculia bacterium]HUM28927.1 glycosyltransferase family 2 protein [Thermoanaerobaculia bacterium]HXK67140.1 glycosyltransferase family 2 protein [Thermoanaerobaculia bacterium]
MKLSILIPVYNEARTITTLLERVITAPLPNVIQREIVIVDDASTDDTSSRLDAFIQNHPECNILHNRHEVNRGKGAALRTGVEISTGDVLLIQDADLEYSPSDYPVILGPVLDGLADVVYGSRFLGGPHRVLFFWHYIGNRFLTLLSNMFTNLNLTDMETCYKVFRREAIFPPRWKSNRFGFEPEITAMVAHAGHRVYEVPIAYHGRSYAEGKKIGWKDGVRAIFTIVWANVREMFHRNRS